MIEDYWLNALWSITPTVLAGVFFWFIMRSIIRADRTERSEYAKLEAHERARRGLPVEGDDSKAAPTSPAKP